MTEHSANEFNPTLSPNDQRLLDTLAEAGFDRKALGSLSAQENLRLDALMNMLGLLRDYPVEDADETLIHATLARIDRYEDEQAERMSFEAQQQNRKERFGWFGSGRIRLPDFITVAAVILIASGILWPLMTTMRQKSIDTACADNLRRLGYGFAQYADDNNSSLPMAMAGPIGTWDTIKNMLNVQPLIGKYCKVSDLSCPGHHDHDALETGPSYSYKMFKSPKHAGWGTGGVTIVLGDLNPIVDAARHGDFMPPMSLSTNHGGRGQNVLRNDGTTMWLDQPVVGGSDNIWLPNGAMRLIRGEMLMDDADVFLTH